MKTTLLLTAVAVVEFLTGMGLLFVPATVSQLLLGQPLDTDVAVVVGRVAGMALIALAMVCWLHRASVSPVGLLVGLLAYNLGVPVILIYSRVVVEVRGIGLWPAVILHLVFAVWIARRLGDGFGDSSTS